jgi:transposase-like protein
MSLPHESTTELFKGCHFNHEIITLCVRWYITYKLSYRDLVEMMAERQIDLAHTTIMRWVQRYVALLQSSHEDKRIVTLYDLRSQ